MDLSETGLYARRPRGQVVRRFEEEKRMKKSILILAVLAVLCIGGIAQAQYIDPWTSVALVPSALNVAPGSMVDVSVEMVLPYDITMTAISTRILYDPSVFIYDDSWVVTQGDLLTHNWDLSGGTPAAGELRVGGIHWDPPYADPLAAGSGSLFTFSLKVRENAPTGNSALSWGMYDGFDNAVAGFDYGDADFVDAILRDSNTSGTSINVNSDVPEPATMVLLMGAGLIGLGIRRLRRK
jgi:hypothetical protein